MNKIPPLKGSNVLNDAFPDYDSEIYANGGEGEPLSLGSSSTAGEGHHMKRFQQQQHPQQLHEDRIQPRYATLIEGARLSQVSRGRNLITVQMSSLTGKHIFLSFFLLLPAPKVETSFLTD